MPRLERTLSVRGYEAGPSGIVPLSAFARYFEHLRWESAEDPAMDLARMFTNGHRMVVRAQQLQHDRPVGVGDVLRLFLWVGRIGRASMDLWHEARLDRSGELVARGLVTAVYLGQDHRPHPIPDDARTMVDAAGVSQLVAPPSARAPAGAWTCDVRVRPSDLDLFDHVNHAVYASYFDDARWLGSRDKVFGDRTALALRPPRALAIDYRREALADQPLEIVAWPLGDGPDQLGFELRRKGDGELLASARMLLSRP